MIILEKIIIDSTVGKNLLTDIISPSKSKYDILYVSHSNINYLLKDDYHVKILLYFKIEHIDERWNHIINLYKDKKLKSVNYIKYANNNSYIIKSGYVIKCCLIELYCNSDYNNIYSDNTYNNINSLYSRSVYKNTNNVILIKK